MSVRMWMIAVLLAAVPTGLRAQPKPDRPPVDYVKVEVRGTLNVAPGFQFDPAADVKAADLGAVVTVGSKPLGLASASRYQLLIADRKQYNLAIASDGKKVVVSGDLDYVMLPSKIESQPVRSPGQASNTLVKYYIRLREIRLADQK